MSLLEQLLSLTSSPVAIAFVDEVPPGVAHVSAVEPAGCGYWRRAAAGEVFYTTADDHKNCPVGAHTHNVPLSSTEKAALTSLVETMVSLQYLKTEEVPHIQTRSTPLRVAVYSPLETSVISPDVVLVRGNPRQLMLLAEAAQAAGVAGAGPTMGRPTCAVVPEAINADRTASSFGCIGNRIYTEAPDDEAYFAIPGAQVPAIEEKLTVIVEANQKLEEFHRARAASAPMV
jgi:uncharacterized protein (DUF169 family)